MSNLCKKMLGIYASFAVLSADSLICYGHTFCMHCSKRKSYSQQQKHAAIIRAARIRHLESKAGQTPSTTQGSRKTASK